MACDPQTLASNASCFFCLPNGYYYPVKLAILARWLKTLNPSADTTPQGLMSDPSAACIACPPGAQLGPLKLALVCSATSGPAAPANFNLDSGSVYGGIVLNWSQTTAPTTNEIWRQINGGGFSLLASVAGALTTYTDTTLYSANRLVEYEVRAVAVSGTSAFTVVRGALIAKDDSASATASYPTVQIILSNYTIHANFGILTVDFPELIAAFNPAVCAINIDSPGPVNQFTSANFPKLVHVGTLNCHGDRLLKSITLSALQTVDQNLDFNNPAIPNSGLSQLICPALVSVGGFIDLTSIAFTGPVSMPLLQTVGNDFVFNGASGVTLINIPSLKTVGASLRFDFGGATSFTSISLPALTSVTAGLVLLGSTSCTSFTANALTTITNNPCQIDNNTTLQTVNMNACTVVGGLLEFANNPNLTTISMSALTHVADVTADDLNLTNNPNLTSINFNSLVEINQSLVVTNCTSLTSLSFPALTNLGEDFNVTGNTLLTSVSLPVFTSQAGNVGFSNNPALSSWNAPNIIFTDGVVIDFTGDALTHTSIEQIVRRGVLSPGLSTCDFEFTGGTNAHLSALSAQGQADVATLRTAGNTVNITP